MSFNDLARGTLLGGKYKVEGMLGQGGMGSVYQAINSTIGRTVAIKLLDARLADNADFVHRFQMEAKAAALIGHPGIVDVLDMGETDEGMPFIVMEYLEGVTLKSLCKRAGALTASQAVAILVPVLDALIAAHAAGVIHRDLKPANIFVCLKPTPAVKILDFGISKFSRGGGSGITQTGTSMGTPAYMSPEQVRGERAIGPQSDLYSIGAILYNLVSGHPPFEGESDLAVVARVLTDLHRPLAQVRPDLPAKLSVICDRLLTKQADQRPADAAQVKRALEAVAKPDFDAVWKAAKVAFDSDTATGLKAQRENPTTPTTPTGGRGAAKASRPALPRQPRVPAAPAQETRAEASTASNAPKFAAFAAVGVLLAGVAGFFTWKALQPAPKPAVMVEEIALGPEPKRPPPAPVKKEAAPTPAEPVPVASILLTLTAVPESARFRVDGEQKGCNPCELKGEAGKKAQVVASAEGFVSRSMELVFDSPREVSLVLAPEPRKGGGRKPSPPPPDKKKNPLSIDEQNPYK